jgi:hypothetical protein
MERTFLSIRSLTDSLGKKGKLCLNCGKIATREALFDVGSQLTVIERYCSLCMIRINE